MCLRGLSILTSRAPGGGKVRKYEKVKKQQAENDEDDDSNK